MVLAKITARTIRQRRNQSLYIWDTELRGFGVRVSPTAVSWLVQRWYGGRGGKGIRYVLGNYPSMSLPEARRQAEIDIGEMRKGTNLVDKRRQLRTQLKVKLNGHTVEQAFNLYLNENTTHNRYWKELENYFRRDILPKLGSLLLSDIDKHYIKDTITGRPRNVFAVLRSFLRWAVKEDYLASDPTVYVTPPKPPKDRDRVLTEAEVKAILQAMQSLSYPWKQFYQLLLLTGQRREEVAGLVWSEIDLDKQVWNLPKERTKNKRAHIVHLTDLAVSILRSTPHRSGYVFLTDDNNRPTAYSTSKNQLDKLSGVSDWVMHDFRRTIVSHMAELGVLPDVADRVLNHVSGTRSGVKGVYQRYEFIRERREALELWSGYLARI